MINANNVCLTYPDGTKALEEIDLSVASGELIYITGPSGSGKTSLLKLMMGVLSPTSGELTVLGQTINKKSINKIQNVRRKIGPVFQDFRLISGRSAIENVMISLRINGYSGHYIKDEAYKLLCRVGLEHKVISNVDNLSWGERQRVAIARAVVRKPELILADEPTGNLDHENALKILELLASFKNNKTAIIITTHATHLIDEEKATHYSMAQGKLERRG